jgi:endonuclease/exonuclease/phosphatase family metal-dependent hydrolase
MTYNVNWDSIFPPLDPANHDLRTASRGMAFARLVAAAQPDVVCLQEINPERDPAETASLLQAALDPPVGQTWTATGARDSLIASRFPVLEDGYVLVVPAFPQELAQAAALIDLPDGQFGALNLYVVCAHFKASGGTYDILLRQRQADVIMRQVGDALTPGGILDLPASTPILILGDFNIYTTDPANHLTTLLTGDIKNENSYGPDVSPDWDGTSLADVLPSHNDLGQWHYTWRNDAAPQEPGILDRILYTDSVLTLEHAFVFNTTLMTAGALTAAGVREADVMLNAQTGVFDHLPVVADVRLLP